MDFFHNIAKKSEGMVAPYVNSKTTPKEQPTQRITPY